mgnify:CR=1 FL=1
MVETINFARQNLYVENLLGRRCYVPMINNKNHSLRSFAERAAINAPMQSLTADIAKMAMIAIDRKLQANLLKTTMTLQIHDELVFEVKKDAVDYCTNIAVNKRYKYTEGSSCNLTVESVVADEEKNLFDMAISPNPFNSQTTISFTLKENKKASVAIYNAFGKILFNKNIDGAKGRNLVTFRKPLEKIEGICYCKITVGHETAVKQLFLVN